MKRIAILLSVIFFLVSCEDMLTEKPKSVAVESFYNTPEEVETAVHAIYGSLRSYNISVLYAAQLNAYTDYCYGRGSYAILSELQGLDNTNITRTGQMWNSFYLGVRNANLVIANAPNGSDLSEVEINQFVGEAKFLRALIYFHIVRSWGKAIIRTESNLLGELPLSSKEEVYKLILDDLIYAENNLPDEPKVSGRATKWAAKSVLTEVYLNLGQYNEAKTKAKEVMNSNKFKLIEVVEAEDFEKLYGAGVTSSEEEIFYLKFSRQSGWELPRFAHHPGSPYGNGGLYAHYTDSEKNFVYKNWDDADLRKEHNWYNWDIGLGESTFLCRKFRDLEAVSNLFANDFPLYRYADILLFFAEADCRAANQATEEGMNALNMVHRRAYGKNSSQTSEIDYRLADYNNVSDFIRLVIKERGYENQYEGKRWLDLKRSSEGLAYLEEMTGKKVAEKHLLWPFPESEKNYNSSIDPSEQNPGY